MKAKFTEATLKNNCVNFIVTKCNAKRCSCCKKLVETTTTTKKETQIARFSKLSITQFVYPTGLPVWMQTLLKQYVAKSKTKLNKKFNNKRNHLNNGEAVGNLVEHYRHSKNCNFEKDLLLISIERLRIAVDESTSSTKKKESPLTREVKWKK